MGRGFEPHTSPQNSKDLVLKSAKSFLFFGGFILDRVTSSLVVDLAKCLGVSNLHQAAKMSSFLLSNPTDYPLRCSVKKLMVRFKASCVG